MKYYPRIEVNQNMIDVINTINKIDFTVLNGKDIVDHIFLISLSDARINLEGRYNSVLIEKSFGIQLSICICQAYEYVIIVNEELCKTNEVDVVVVILHEIGHIINVGPPRITPIYASRMGVNFIDEDKKIRLQNELYADYIVKKCGYKDELIDSLCKSISHFGDAVELNARIESLRSDQIHLSNQHREHPS